MIRHTRLNRLDAFAIVSVLITTFLFFPRALHAAYLYAGIGEISVDRRLIGLLGWLFATFGPILSCVSLWRLYKRLPHAWLVHVAFFPVALGLFNGGDRMMLYAAGEWDWDGVIGGPILQAMFLFMLAVIGYYSAAIWTAAAAWRSRAQVR